MKPTVTDWMLAWSGVATACFSAAVLAQLFLLSRQIRLAKEQLQSSVHWNKLNAAFTYFNTDTILGREKAAAVALGGVGFDLYRATDPLTDAQVEQLKADPVAYFEVKSLLNLIENYAVVLRLGAIDEDAAFGMESGMVTRWERLLRNFIADRRATLGISGVFCDIQRLAKRWRNRLKHQFDVSKEV